MKLKISHSVVWAQVLVVSILVCLAAYSLYALLLKSAESPSYSNQLIVIKPHKTKMSNIVLGAAIPVPKHEVQVVSSGGRAPVISKINTSQKVIFLTIDDGGTKNADMLGLLTSNGIKASLFLDNNFISNNYDFFKAFKAAGMYIENHAVHHIYAKPGAISYENQKQEICGMADIIQNKYGQRPTLYRAPGGWIDSNTTAAAAACGMKAVVQWSAKVNGGAVQYQVGSSFRPGDIVLMHFRPEFKSDLEAFIKAKDSAGLTTDYLENWI